MVRYSITNLGSLNLHPSDPYGHESSVMHFPTDVNADGQVVGYVFDHGYSVNVRAFFHDGTTMLDITPTLMRNGTPVLGPSYADSEATAMNNHGYIVGNLRIPGGGPFVRKPDGTTHYLAGVQGDRVFDINDDGVAVGLRDSTPNPVIALRWNVLANTPPEEIGPPNAWSAAFKINNSGVIVGSVGDDHQQVRPALYENGQWTAFPPHMGGGPHTYVYPPRPPEIVDINNSGTITGAWYWYSPMGWGYVSHPFLYKQGVLTALPSWSGPGAGRVNSIDDHNNVVGDGAWLYTEADGIMNLSDLIPPNTGMNLLGADVIRDPWIVGGGSYPIKNPEGVSFQKSGVWRLKRRPSAPPRDPRIKPGTVWQILVGSRAGETGWGKGPGRPIGPIPPGPGPEGTAASMNLLDALDSLALFELARCIDDPEFRRRVQPLLLEKAIKRLEELRRESKLGDSD